MALMWPMQRWSAGYLQNVLDSSPAAAYFSKNSNEENGQLSVGLGEHKFMRDGKSADFPFRIPHQPNIPLGEVFPKTLKLLGQEIYEPREVFPETLEAFGKPDF